MCMAKSTTDDSIKGKEVVKKDKKVTIEVCSSRKGEANNNS